MTQDIIEMARQAGVRDDERIFEFSQYKYLERFVNLVADKERENWPAEMKAMENQVNILTDELAKAVEEANARANASWTLMCKKMVDIEREACAKVCEEYANGLERNYSEIIADAIRARGEQA